MMNVHRSSRPSASVPFVALPVELVVASYKRFYFCVAVARSLIWT